MNERIRNGRVQTHRRERLEAVETSPGSFSADADPRWAEFKREHQDVCLEVDFDPVRGTPIIYATGWK